MGRTISSYSSYWQDRATFHYKKTWEKCECFWFNFHVLSQSSSNKERNLMRNQTYFPHQSHIPTFIHPFIHSCVYTHTPNPRGFCLLALMLLHTLPLKLLSIFWEPINKKTTWHKNKRKLSWICSYKVTLFLANEICIMRFIVFVALPGALALP